MHYLHPPDSRIRDTLLCSDPLLENPGSAPDTCDVFNYYYNTLYGSWFNSQNICFLDGNTYINLFKQTLHYKPPNHLPTVHLRIILQKYYTECGCQSFALLWLGQFLWLPYTKQSSYYS